MRILTISAFFPPYTYGGYEIRIGDIMDGLSARGHKIHVLTTKPDPAMKAAPKSLPYPVVRRLNSPSRKMRFADRLTTHKLTRWLGIALVFLREIKHDIQDMALIDQEIRSFQPDLLYLGHIMPLTRALMPFLARQALPIVADEGGKGLIYSWEDHGLWQRFQAEFPQKPGFKRWVKQAINRAVRQLSHGRVTQEWAFPADIQAFFNSNLNLRNALSSGVPLERTQVIHSGIDLEMFPFKREKEFGNPLTILVPGRIEENKGQLDAIQLGVLLKEQSIPFELTLVGERWNQSYTAKVEAEIQSSGLGNQVRILPMISREALVQLFYKADICFFPSYQRAGFSRIPLEAMACGSVIISYGNEGSDEVIRAGENGFLASEGDVEAISEIISCLMSHPKLCAEITQNAREIIEIEFSLQVYLSKIENYLNTAVENLGVRRTAFIETMVPK